MRERYIFYQTLQSAMEKSDTNNLNKFVMNQKLSDVLAV